MFYKTANESATEKITKRERRPPSKEGAVESDAGGSARRGNVVFPEQVVQQTRLAHDIPCKMTVERKPSILIVDDNTIVLEVAQAALEAAGFEVSTRSRGEGAVAAILQQKPDLVLLDVSMPHTRGDTIASIVASAAPAQKTILLLYSGLSPESLELKIRQTGAHGYIQKTDNTADLVGQVRQWLKRGPPPPRARSSPR